MDQDLYVKEKSQVSIFIIQRTQRDNFFYEIILLYFGFTLRAMLKLLTYLC